MEEMIGTVPFIARSVMTRCAARMMIFQYLRNAELWHEEGHLLESEIDEIRHSVKETLIDLADHPAQESPPDLKEEARHIECLFYLNSGDIARVVESGAVKEESYYGDSKIITRGEHAAANGKNSWFFLTRGTVRRTVLRPDNSEAHSLHHRGMLFGIGDEMLNRPHHASYSSSTFCTLISFDADMLKSLSNDIPALRRGLWNSVGAHALRHCALVRPDSHFASMTLKLLHEILEASAMHLLPKVEEQAAEGAEPERRTLSIPSGGVMLLLSAKAIDLKVPGGGSARASHLGHGMASTVTSPGSAVAELELPLMITNDGASPIAVTLEALAAEAAGESVAFVIPPHAIAQASSTEKATCSVIEHRKRLSTDLRMASTSALLGQDGRRSISRRALSVSSMGPRGSSAPVRRPTQLRRRLSIRTSSDRR
jgi:CRP-like cAMP-binding protein